ncbi:uncharacterized protein avpi1 [Etheostoma spectabile]|uniref:uncharacterized protein avpi1 n=1 Tax=Etheostoma spectabile TaxID=54343 RepID=UPI0013AF6232|nr:uncharacterized protein LOC116704246 [Etheostoma spectabile]
MLVEGADCLPVHGYSLSHSNYRLEAFLPACHLPPLKLSSCPYFTIWKLHLCNMAEALASTSSEDGLPLQWKLSNQRSRKSGCSNIFTGLNLHQLHRLFRTAGDRDAEHRAKLVWRGMDADIEGAQEVKEEEGEDSKEEAGLAQALVGLRVRARNKSGIRAEGHRDHKGLRASGYLRIEESLSGNPVEDEEADIGHSSATEEDISENQNPFKPSSWRLGVARHEGVGPSERYLHRIIH